MTVAPDPVPNAIPAPGVNLAVAGADAAGLPSLAGLTAPTFAWDDAAGTFAYVVAPDSLSVTVIPNPGVEGTATITFTAGTTNDDGSVGQPVSATYVAAVVPGNAVSVTLEATDLPAAG